MIEDVLRGWRRIYHLPSAGQSYSSRRVHLSLLSYEHVRHTWPFIHRPLPLPVHLPPRGTSVLSSRPMIWISSSAAGRGTASQTTHFPRWLTIKAIAMRNITSSFMLQNGKLTW